MVRGLACAVAVVFVGCILDWDSDRWPDVALSPDLHVPDGSPDLDAAVIDTEVIDAAVKAPCGPNLLVHLKLDEPNGTASFLDATGSGHDGKCATGTCPIAGEAGAVGTAALFDGLDDRVVLSNSTTLHPPSFTIAVWVEVTGIGADANGGAVVIKRETDYSKYTFHLDIDWNPVRSNCVYKAAGTWYGNTAGTLLKTNRWYHLACVFNSATSELSTYVDGSLETTTQTSVPPPKTAGAIVIGGNGSNGDDPFKGHIDDVRICGVALQPADICTLAGRAWDSGAKKCL